MTSLMDISSVNMLGLFGLAGHWEIVIIALLILLLFGGKKLPELARGFAKGLRELKGVKTDITEVGQDIVKDVTEMKETKSEDQSDQQDQT